MNLNDVFNLLENNEEFKSYIDKIIKQNRRTKVAYLESLNRLSYLLYLNREEMLTEKLLKVISQIAFEGDYDYWTFIESSIVLLAFIQDTNKNKVLELKNLLLGTLEYGDDFIKRINTNVHKRFLSGGTLENRNSKIEQTSNLTSKIEYRLLYLSDLLKINLFIDDSSFMEEDICSKINEQIIFLRAFIDENSIFALFPFKARK